MSHRPVAASDQALGTLTAARQPPSCTTTELSIEARRESYGSELTSHRHRCNQPSRARSECERVPRRNSRRARAQASSRYHQSAAQLAVTKGRPNMMHILASVIPGTGACLGRVPRRGPWNSHWSTAAICLVPRCGCDSRPSPKLVPGRRKERAALIRQSSKCAMAELVAQIRAVSWGPGRSETRAS